MAGGYLGWHEQRALLLLEGARPLSSTLSDLGPGSHIVRIDAVTSHGWDFEFCIARGGKRRWLWAAEYAARHALCDAVGVPFFKGTGQLIGRDVGIALSWDGGPQHLRATTGEYLAVTDGVLVATAPRRSELPAERTMRWRPFPLRRSAPASEPATPIAARRHEHQDYERKSQWPSTQRTSK